MSSKNGLSNINTYNTFYIKASTKNYMPETKENIGEFCKNPEEVLNSKTANIIFKILTEQQQISLKEFLAKNISDYSIIELKIFIKLFFSKEKTKEYKKIVNRIHFKDFNGKNIGKKSLHELKTNIISIDIIKKHLYEKLTKVYYELLKKDPDFLVELFNIDEKYIPQIKKFEGIGFIVLEVVVVKEDSNTKKADWGYVKNEKGEWIAFGKSGNEFIKLEIKGIKIIDTRYLIRNKKTGGLIYGEVKDENGNWIPFRKKGDEFIALEIEGIIFSYTKNLAKNRETGEVVSGKAINESGKWVKFKKNSEGKYVKTSFWQIF